MDGIMKENWSNEHAKCIVTESDEIPEEMRERIREVSQVWTDPDHRMQGYATELMKEVCEQADVENVVLMLQPRPYDSASCINKEKLIEWYKRFGFVITQKSPVLMARAPEFKVRQNMVSAAVERALRGKTQ